MTYYVVFLSQLKGVEEFLQDPISRPFASLELRMLSDIIAAFEIFSRDHSITSHVHLSKRLVDEVNTATRHRRLYNHISVYTMWAN